MRSLLFLSAMLSLAACSTDGTGSLRVRISGEGPAMTGYPFDDGADVIAFVDGWSLTYARVLVSVSGFELQTRSGASAGPPTDGVVADLHLDTPIAWQLDGVPARRWDRLSYDLVPPTASSRLLAGVGTTDAARMISGSCAMLIEGTATNGAASVPFSFCIPDPVRAYDCESGIDGTEGVVVGVNAVDDVELTIHLDHLFLDSVSATEPNMRFEPLAALAGADSMLTLDDLATTPVTDIEDRSGNYIVVDGHVLVYDPGPFPLDANRSIASYVRANATTMGHLEGEGHCKYVLDPTP